MTKAKQKLIYVGKASVLTKGGSLQPIVDQATQKFPPDSTLRAD